MEEDDEIQSPPTAVTVAAAPPSNSLTLALPIQHQKTPGSGGGREDCWSEGATAVLIGAWGERYLELSRGNLKQKHWKDVADIVSSREDYTKTPKTDIQCKNRIDTVKKKYKVEKAKVAAGGAPSKWRFYDKLDELIGPIGKMTSNPVPIAIPVSVGVRSSSSDRFQPRPNWKRPHVDSDDESEPENSGDSSDGLPPESHKRPRMANNVGEFRQGMMMNKRSDLANKESSSGDSMRELTRAIFKFGEAYERAETAKLQQLVEMEKQRMKFAKDLELQRMQYFMKTQLELSHLKNKRPGNNNNNINNNENENEEANNNNNSDSSN